LSEPRKANRGLRLESRGFRTVTQIPLATGDEDSTARFRAGRRETARDKTRPGGTRRNRGGLDAIYAHAYLCDFWTQNAFGVPLLV
jgi:hypothetical protein